MGSRSWTDNVTNSILFRGLDSPSYLRWLARRDLNDVTLVGPFLHEFTHHWCYRTLLGATLALTELRLAVLAEAYPDGRAVWARDFVAYRMLTHLLRPMSEGLSQMAEFDLTHISGEAHAGTPLGASVLCFGAKGDDIFRHAMLQTMRHSQEMLDRKASLYLKSFEVENGYLPGYMAAKNAAFAMVGRGYNVPIEVFLAYMRSYFWDDPVLINTLISENMNGGEVAEELFGRFRDRFLALYSEKDLPDRVQSFWKKWRPDEPARCAVELGCEERDFTLATERIGILEQHFHTLVDRDAARVESVTGMPPERLHGLVQDLADARRYVAVASAEVLVEASGETSVVGTDGATESAPELESYMTPLAPGRYEVTAVIPTFATFQGVLAAGADGQVSAMLEVQLPGVDDGIRQSTLRFIGNRRALQAAIEKLRTRFFDTGVKVLASKVVDEILAWSYETARQFYAAAACARVLDRQKAEEARNQLLARGLKPLFAGDTVAARLVAGMSMLSGTDQWIQQDADGLVKVAQVYYLQESEVEDLMKRRDAVLARDDSGLLLRRVDEVLMIYV